MPRPEKWRPKVGAIFSSATTRLAANICAPFPSVTFIVINGQTMLKSVGTGPYDKI